MAFLTIKDDTHLTIRKLQRVPRAIQRANVKSIKTVLKWGQRRARSLAPQATGDLKAGIIIRSIKRSGKVVSASLISKVRKSFPYQKWVNEDIKTVTLPTVYYKSIKKWPTGATRKRLGIERKWRYRNTNHSGTPGYFRITFNEMKKKFPAIAMGNLKSELKAALK